ncbi:MAG: putative Ig domain-containing protein [Planctomycetota bacterium]|nr:putative Ig domain-containing protein [Planctomycetota bacterium]
MISTSCPACQAKFRVKPSLAGRSIKCPKCRNAVAIPTVESSEQIAAARQQPLAVDLPQFPDPLGSTPTSSGAIPIDTSVPVNKRKKSSTRRGKNRPVLLWIVGLLLLAAVGVGAFFLMQPPPTEKVKLAIQEITDRKIAEFQPLVVDVPISNRKAFGNLEFQLAKAPPRAAIDATNGRISWTPGEADGPGSFEFVVTATGPGASKAKQSFQVEVTEQNQPPRFEPVANGEAEPDRKFSMRVRAVDPDEPQVAIHYLLDTSAPLGVLLDPSSGELTWTPSTDDAGRLFSIKVTATEIASDALSADTTVSIEVVRTTTPTDTLIAKLQASGARVLPASTVENNLSFEPAAKTFDVNGRIVQIFEYADAGAARRDLAEINVAESTVGGTEWQADDPLHVFHDDVLVATYRGGDEKMTALLAAVIGRPYAVLSKKVVATVVEVPKRPEIVEQLIGLYEERDSRAKKNRMLFSTREYNTVRKAFAVAFEKTHAAQLEAAFGESHGEMMQWLAEHQDLKEELFTAFKPEHDDVVAGLKLFQQIKEQFPTYIERYGSLAIAIAVTWDKERPAVYDYEGHARRTHSTMPSNLSDGLENFRYLTTAESVMQGRILYVPWEFLTLIVDHKTPTAERTWAVQNYVPQRVMFGKCYADVPYDTVMLETQSQVCRLDGQEYNLPNIRQLGGVCAMQADFAARVGKSIGVPAAYVRGTGRSGGLHAWVMWVELKAVTAKSIAFKLESHGRYRGDRYYVGTLRDPQTGEQITDRILELRMHQVGVNAQAKRHADRIMSLYPELAKELKLDFAGRIEFLQQAMTLNPWSEAAWTALSKIHEGEELSKLQAKQMNAAMNQLFVNFAAFPDFTLTIFDDLIGFEPDKKQRIKLHYRLLDVYASAQRPDLSFQGLLSLTDKLVEENREGEAIQALAVAIKKYNDEGKYVPNMLDRLEKLAANVEGSEPKIVAFYNEFLPLIPQTRGNRPSAYCVEMFERGIKKFQSTGQANLVQLYQTQLALIKAGRGRKS